MARSLFADASFKWIQTLIGTVILAGDLLLQYAALFLLKAVYTFDAVISTGFVVSKISIFVAIVVSFVNPMVSYILRKSFTENFGRRCQKFNPEYIYSIAANQSLNLTGKIMKCSVKVSTGSKLWSPVG